MTPRQRAHLGVGALREAACPHAKAGAWHGVSHCAGLWAGLGACLLRASVLLLAAHSAVAAVAAVAASAGPGRTAPAMATVPATATATATATTTTNTVNASAAAAAAAVDGAGHCQLLLSEHRSGRPLAALPLPAAHTGFQIAFVHSVLGTPVVDDYRFRRGADGQWRAHLEAEQFEGQGYGLPYAADPDPSRAERLQRVGTGWRLTLDRLVDPLVVLPLPSQRMRLLLPGVPPLLLGDLSPRSVHFSLRNCPCSRAQAVLDHMAQP